MGAEVRLKNGVFEARLQDTGCHWPDLLRRGQTRGLDSGLGMHATNSRIHYCATSAKTEGKVLNGAFDGIVTSDSFKTWRRTQQQATLSSQKIEKLFLVISLIICLDAAGYTCLASVGGS